MSDVPQPVKATIDRRSLPLALVLAATLLATGCGQSEETAASLDDAAVAPDHDVDAESAVTTEPDGNERPADGGQDDPDDPAPAASPTITGTTVADHAEADDSSGAASADAADEEPLAGGGSTAPAVTGESPAGTPSCVTVPTTVPGDEFCPGYEPFPDEPGSEGPPATTDCPAWAEAPVSRPAGGWFGTSSDGPLDTLDRWWTANDPDPVVDANGPELEELAAQARALVPERFTESGTHYSVVPTCRHRTLRYGIRFVDGDGAQLSISRFQLIGQIDWSAQPPTWPLTERSVLADGSDLIVAGGEPGYIRRAWIARPDGRLIAVTAYGPNVATYAGFPTTFPTLPTSDPAAPFPLSGQEIIDLASTLGPG